MITIETISHKQIKEKIDDKCEENTKMIKRKINHIADILKYQNTFGIRNKRILLLNTLKI